MGRTYRGNNRPNKKERQKIKEFRHKRTNKGFYEDESDNARDFKRKRRDNE